MVVRGAAPLLTQLTQPIDLTLEHRPRDWPQAICNLGGNIELAADIDSHISPLFGCPVGTFRPVGAAERLEIRDGVSAALSITRTRKLTVAIVASQPLFFASCPLQSRVQKRSQGT
jgi:hypothetical protein